MVLIPVKVCGDEWLNIEQVSQLLYQSDISQHVVLDFFSEGPSIQALGIAELLDQYCQDSGRDKKTIVLINNPNRAEITQYHNNGTGPSHFFAMSRDYWTDVAPLAQTAKSFGFFIGRPTLPRICMLYDLWNQYQDHCLMSKMNTVAPLSNNNFTPLHQAWNNYQQQKNILSWFKNCPISSIDGHSVQDQYVSNPCTNQDLLKFYNQFEVEIVAETYSMGATFFPTEKTVRPIMAAKPFITHGPRNFLQNLKKLGFETYDDCWDESYDQLEGFERWQAIKQILPTVVITQTVIQKSHHNRQYLAQMIKL